MESSLLLVDVDDEGVGLYEDVVGEYVGLDVYGEGVGLGVYDGDVIELPVA